MDTYNVKLNEGNGGFGRNNGNLESSGSSVSPDNDGRSDALSKMRIAERNANFSYGNVNPGPNTGRHPFLSNANILSPGGDLTGNSIPLSYAPSPNMLSSGILSGSINNDSPVSQWSSFTVSGQSITQDLKKRQQVRETAMSTSLPGLGSQYNHLSLPYGMNQESSNLLRLIKKPRIDVSPNNMMQRHIANQLLSGRVPNQFQDNGHRLRALMEHYGQQSQLDKRALSPFPQWSGVQGRPEEEQQVVLNIERQGICPATCTQWVDTDVCSRRLAQYLNHLQTRPKDNHIDFWKNFVSEFYAPSAKERLCFSQYANLGQRATSVLTLGTIEAQRCDACGSSSVKGFEASFAVLPRVWKTKYDTGILEESLRLDWPQECRYPSGIMVLKYDKAVQQSVYDQFRVIREGKLRITFRQDLKILSWEFCATHHEEYLLRQRIEPQVNQFLEAAYKYHGAVHHSTTKKNARRDAQASSNLLAKAGDELSRAMKLPIVNEVGFARGHVRCMQIGEVVDMMRDLITFSTDRRIGPIESLHRYVLENTTSETQGSVLTEEPQQTKQDESIRDGRQGGNKLMAKHVGTESLFGDTASTGNLVFPDGGEREMGIRASYYQKLIGEDTFNQLGSDMIPDQPFLMNRSREAMPTSFPDHPYPNPTQSCDPWYTQMVRTESSEAHQHIQQQHLSEQYLQEEAGLKSVMNAFGKQKVQVVDTEGNIIPGLPTGYGSRSIIRDGPNFGKQTPEIKEPSLFINEQTFLGNFTRNSDKAQGSSNTVKKQADNQNLKQADVLLKNFRPCGSKLIFIKDKIPYNIMHKRISVL